MGRVAAEGHRAHHAAMPSAIRGSISRAIRSISMVVRLITSARTTTNAWMIGKSRSWTAFSASKPTPG